MQRSAMVNYHIKSPDPQAFQFDVDGVIGTLIEPVLIPTQVSVTDLRGHAEKLHLVEDGVMFAHHTSQIHAFTADDSWVSTYNDEITELLNAKIGAKEVIVFDHTVRIDDPNALRRPARNVHNDYSQSGAEQRLIDILGEEKAAEFARGHYAFVNIWRPVEHTIRTAPLGFIHPDSMAIDDWMSIELIYPDRHGQILGVAANSAHRWIYLSEMTPKEIAIFTIYDNRGQPHVGHSALDIGTSDGQYPRKSIESRVLVRYDG
ncbi:CmcJ/NvfI family oxidoreductase [Enterovibrio coralii]|uniref:Methyltransferase n=1 Tax=Enterovibrio coralii TaxID=294935 RepID=A0A135I2Y3_9GAMM|nr:CmcJ/NvfI family oxidoreductase [Enterovibrio coralii]KXF79797.1 hypothetical protein ATN88_12940 [Enterovibrio coralii]